MLMPITGSAAPVARGLSAGLPIVGTLTVRDWMPDGLRSRRHDPDTAEV